MFEFAEKTKDMTALEILNYYRNLYYAEPQVTERGIVANAINDVIADVAPMAEVAREIFAEIKDLMREWFDFFMQDNDTREACAIMAALSQISELKKKYTEENQNG